MTAPAAGVEEARRQWEGAGLPFPFVPPSLASAFHRLGEWSFGTGDALAPAYVLDDHLHDALDGSGGDLALLAHAGHGVASWAMHWYVVLHPVAVFVQSAWGAAGAGEEQDRDEREQMRRRFAAAESLTRLAVETPVAPGRLLVLVSDFRASGWGVLRPGAPVEWQEVRDPFAPAEAWLRDDA